MQKDIRDVFVLVDKKYGRAIFEDTSKLVRVLEDVAPWLYAEIQALNTMSTKKIGLQLRADTSEMKAKLQKQLMDELAQKDEERRIAFQRCIYYISDLVNNQSSRKMDDNLKIAKLTGQGNKSVSIVNSIETQNQRHRMETPCWKLENNGKVIRVISFGSGNKFRIDYEIKDGIEKVIIEEGVTETTLEAFSGLKKLKEIVFPTTLVKVGYSSFENCHSLTKVTLPVGVKTVAGKAFRNCTCLREVIIPETVKYIGDDAFLGYKGQEIIVNGNCVICPGNYPIKAR